MTEPSVVSRIRHRLFVWTNFTPHRWNCTHQNPYWTAAPRCISCGHRQTDAAGRTPRQTREYLRSPWTWPLAAFELTGRAEAWWRGVLHRNRRLPL